MQRNDAKFRVWLHDPSCSMTRSTGSSNCATLTSLKSWTIRGSNGCAESVNLAESLGLSRCGAQPISPRCRGLAPDARGVGFTSGKGRRSSPKTSTAGLVWPFCSTMWATVHSAMPLEHTIGPRGAPRGNQHAHYERAERPFQWHAGSCAIEIFNDHHPKGFLARFGFQSARHGPHGLPQKGQFFHRGHRRSHQF